MKLFNLIIRISLKLFDTVLLQNYVELNVYKSEFIWKCTIKTAEIALIVGARILIQYIIINTILAPWPVTLTGPVRYHFIEAVDWGFIGERRQWGWSVWVGGAILCSIKKDD